MNSTDHLHIIQLTAGLGLLFFGYSFMYVRTRLDNFREHLFSLRDELFDYMWKNDIPYSMPAYGMLRNVLNGNIRFARKTWLFSLWFMTFVVRAEELRVLDEAHTPIMDAIEKIPDVAIRHYYRNLYLRLGSRVLDYIFLEGPLWPIAVLVRMYLRGRGAAEAQRKMGFDVMADEAAQLGRPNSRVARELLHHGV